MARPCGRRSLSLSLAVIAAIVLAISAGGWFAGTGSHAPPTPPTTPAGTLPVNRSVSRGAAPESGSQRGLGVRGTAPPGIPVMLTVASPNGSRILSGPVDPIAATRRPDGSWAPINPPTRSHAVWVSQSAIPAAPSTGTTAVYGHACIGYACVFNDAVRIPPGSTVTIRTQRSVLRYQVVSVIQYPKTGTTSLASRPNLANELILVTCAYRPDHTTVDNLVLVARLVAARVT
jgi:LPXTG-site transpeptidase (sortase) family protein